MKKERVRYLLLTAVAAVWGVIFYRIFAAAPGSSLKPASIPIVQVSAGRLPLTTDTFTLALNYADPFLDPIAEDDPEPLSTEPIAVRPAPAPVKPALNWKIIGYKGYILNPGQKKAVSIITIEGMEYMIAEGGTAAGVTVLQNRRDSVKVSYRNETNFIQLK